MMLFKNGHFLFLFFNFESYPTCQQLNPFPNKPWFFRVCSTSLLKTQGEKEKLHVTSNFSFSRCAFYPLGELSAIFIRFNNCRLQNLSGWKSLKFVVWKRVNQVAQNKGKEEETRRIVKGHGWYSSIKTIL